jgi:hypothetical protein
VNGGLATGCTIVRERRVRQWRAPRTKPHDASTRRAVGSQGRRRVRETRTRVGCNHRTGGPQENPKERSVGETWGRKGAQSPAERSEQEQRISCRSKAPRAGKNHDVSRRRGGSGLGGSRRIGETKRAPRKMRAPVSSGGCDRGVRGTIAVARGFGTKRPHVARAIRRSDAERRETLSSSARWAATHRDHARRRVGDAGPGKRQGTGARSLSCGKQRLDRTHL